MRRTYALRPYLSMAKCAWRAPGPPESMRFPRPLERLVVPEVIQSMKQNDMPMNALAPRRRRRVKSGDTRLRGASDSGTEGIYSEVGRPPGALDLVEVVNRLFNFRAVHHPAPGSYARGVLIEARCCRLRLLLVRTGSDTGEAGGMRSTRDACSTGRTPSGLSHGVDRGDQRCLESAAMRPTSVR